ncbi:NACHT, LRR and PYD domains-containing protein 3-like [Protopterus annectens]|uniref:NACHT, LRR and PYD domains-containing protein 3-like n=1 Tax=Protopterus annectens TaxID=7888 RepID=UPI001CFA42D2|nr:NACHT, LRR and PYD domains-containing protein 3-like [Protopterus annectens]
MFLVRGYPSSLIDELANEIIFKRESGWFKPILHKGSFLQDELVECTHEITPRVNISGFDVFPIFSTPFSMDANFVRDILYKNWAVIIDDPQLRNKLSETPKVVYKRGVNLKKFVEKKTQFNVTSGVRDIIHEAGISKNGHILDDNMKGYQSTYKQSILQETRTIRKKVFPGRNKQEEDLLVEHYTELRIITTYQRTWGQAQHELLLKGSEHEGLMKKTYLNKCERITANQLFRICYESKRFPQIVLILGVPGIGKTTMVQKLLLDWIQGDHYKQFMFVFLFKFRDMNLWDEPLNLAEMILKNHACLRNILAEILKKTSTILFIFDGLDESKSPLDFTETQLCSNICQRTSASNIVSSLMKQTLLKGCSVIVTSRPTALERVELSCIHLCAEIIGFLAEERKRYFRKQFYDERNALDAFHYVEQNDILYTMCFNPSYCWIICSVLKPYFIGNQNKCTSCPKTLTQLFVHFLKNILTNHMSADSLDLKELLSKVSRLAFNGVCNRLLVFYDADIKQLKLKHTQALSSFMFEFMIKEEYLWRTMYSFMHLTVQEFLGALSYFLNSEQNISQVLENDTFKDGRLEMLICFLAGLSHPPTSHLLQKILGHFPDEKNAEILHWLKRRAEYLILTEGHSHKRELLRIFHYLLETQNTELIKQTIGKIAHLDFRGVLFNPMDCYVLNYIIVACNGFTKLNLSLASFPEEGVRKLIQAISLCMSIR